MRLQHLALLLLAGALTLPAQQILDTGLWQGYDGEWGYTSRQLLLLADAIPAEKFAWRPAPGVRSVSEVIMHIAQSNYALLAFTGPRMPAELDVPEKRLPATKAEVLDWLKKSLESVRAAHLKVTPAELRRKVTIVGRSAEADGIYLRILVHANEHMGQLVAYARMNGITPPWSK